MPFLSSEELYLAETFPKIVTGIVPVGNGIDLLKNELDVYTTDDVMKEISTSLDFISYWSCKGQRLKAKKPGKIQSKVDEENMSLPLQVIKDHNYDDQQLSGSLEGREEGGRCTHGGGRDNCDR